VTRSTRPLPASTAATAAADPRPTRVRIPLSTRIVTERLLLRAYRVADVRAARAFEIDNEDHFRPWNPRPRPGESPRSLTTAAKKIASARRDWRNDRGYAFAVFLRSASRSRSPASRRAPPPLVGRVALNLVGRGTFQNAYLGYLIGAAHQGKGLMREAVAAACDFAFGAARLHRVQAAIMPHNDRSLRLIRALGFREEGRARHYLMIDGEWRDHLIFAITSDEWPHRAPANAAKARLGDGE
jgi:ribosomal-protein-alanine N-acetyltransferase